MMSENSPTTFPLTPAQIMRRAALVFVSQENRSRHNHKHSPRKPSATTYTCAFCRVAHRCMQHGGRYTRTFVNTHAKWLDLEVHTSRNIWLNKRTTTEHEAHGSETSIYCHFWEMGLSSSGVVSGCFNCDAKFCCQQQSICVDASDFPRKGTCAEVP